ncbi:UbiH/UbiF family hydroxylase [soil metagenome]
MIPERHAYHPGVVTQAQFDLVVAGRGIVGSACALAAGQLGLRTALVGRAPFQSTAAWDDRVYALAPAARGWLGTLKVERQLDAHRLAPVLSMRIAEQPGSQPLELSSYSAAVPELATIVESRELHRVLDLGISLQPRITVHDAEIDGCEFAAQHVRVTARPAGTGKSGPSIQLQAPLVIAADGSDSSMRRAAGLEGRSRDYGQRGVVARLALARPHHGTASQWFLGDSVLALLPMPADSARDREPSRIVSMVWSVDQARAEQLIQLDTLALAREIGAACGEAAGPVEVLSAPQSFPLRYFAADRLVAPRLALVGDAAHLMHPLAGQGLNTGLLDAQALLATLAVRESFLDPGDVRLLRRYARARAEPIARILLLTDGLQRLFKTDNPLLGAIRSIGLGMIEGIPPVKRRLVEEAVASSVT